MKKLAHVLCVATFTPALLFFSQAHGALILGVTASTDMPSDFFTELENTVNGAGLPSGTPSLTGFHEATIPDNSWVSSQLTGSINFSFGGTYLVDGFSFWNQNDGGPGLDGTTGINEVLVMSSSDGVNFTMVPGAPTSFAQVDTFGSAPEMFSFSPVSASHLRFDVLGNHGDPSNVGFAEVQFSESLSVVPEPTSTLSLAALLAGGLLLRSRRKRAI